MPSDGAAPDPVDRERRLHPFSWLFVLLTQLRGMALPIVALMIFNRGNAWELIGLAGAGGLALYSLVYSLGFRYRLGRDELYVREGVLGRTERHVKYARIQNVVQQRNLLHRAFGVTELRLESAGGARPEALMNVITLAEAQRVEAVLRGHGQVAADAAEPEPPLFIMPPRELVRLGLVTNRGVVVVGAVFALAFQVDAPDTRVVPASIDLVRTAVAGWSTTLAGPIARVSAGALVVAAFLVALKLLSVAVAFVSFHRFSLRRDGERLTSETGLLTRRTASARRDKVQRLLAGESWLARALGRRSLRCDVAAGVRAANEGESDRFQWLAPLAAPSTVERLIDEVAPGLSLERREWRPLHPAAWRRRFNPRALAWTLAAVLAVRWFGPWMLLAWPAGLAWSWHAARAWARFSAYSVDDRVIAVRLGWLQRDWAVASIAKGQVVRLSESPFDRRHGMGSVLLDTAGSGFGSIRLGIPYLPRAEARAVADQLRRGVEAQERTPSVEAAPGDADSAVPTTAD